MAGKQQEAKVSAAEIVREYGPFAGCTRVDGVTYDGTHFWFASGDRMQSVEIQTGNPGAYFEVAADAGCAFDGKHFFQISGSTIRKIDAKTREVVATIPAPGPAGDNTGLTWSDGTLWVGQYKDRSIVQIDAATGKVIRRIKSPRLVTGVTFVDGELWHGTWEGDASELRHVDPDTGELIEQLDMPAGTNVSGLESDGRDLFFCGGGGTGKIRTVKKPRRAKK